MLTGHVTATGGTAGITGVTPGVKRDGPSFGDVMSAFTKEARMTPAQRIRRDVLKDHRLTEESLAAMTPAERKVIEDRIAPIIKRRVEVAEEEARRRGKQIGLPSL